MSPKPSAIVLVAANLTPLAGVLMLDWRVFDVMILYWAENIVVGAVNVLRMLACSARRRVGFGESAADSSPVGFARSERRAETRGSRRSRLFLMPFFILHYGIFCFGHYTAVMAIFGDQVGSSEILATFAVPLAEAWRSPLWIGFGAIAASHLFSFYANYIRGEEYLRTTPSQLMKRPYGRIVVMHVAIIAGGALVFWLGSPLPMLLVLIAVKIGIDLRMHYRERHTFSFDNAGSRAGSEL